MRSIVGGATRAAPPQVQPRLDLQAAAGREPARVTFKTSGAGGGRSTKEAKGYSTQCQSLERLILRSEEWGLHTALTGIHPLHSHSDLKFSSYGALHQIFIIALKFTP